MNRALALGLAASLLGALAPPVRAFDIIECDGGATFGDAAPLRGWRQPTDQAMGLLVIDDQGAADSGLTGAQVVGFWEAAMADWESTSDSQFRFPPREVRTVGGAELGEFRSGDESRHLLTVIQPTTTIPAGTTLSNGLVFTADAIGWAAITGTDPSTTLGVAINRIDRTTRYIFDSDVYINDDTFDFQPGGFFDMQYIITHELGHLMGIDHAVNFTSVMFASAVAGVFVPLTEDDRNASRFLYPTPGSSPTPPDRNQVALTSCDQTLDEVAAAARSAGPLAGGCRAVAAAAGSGALVAWVLLLLGTWARARTLRPRGRVVRSSRRG